MKRAFFAAFLAIATGASAFAGPLGILGERKGSQEQEIKSSFQSFRYDKTADWERLKKICVKPVDVSQLPNSTPWLSLPQELSKKMDAELPALAEALQTAFRDELKARSGKSWELVESPDDETAVLQLSITRLVPVDPDSASKQPPSISFDGRLLDKKTGKTVMSFSETKPLKGAPWQGDAKDSFKAWAACFAEMSMPEHGDSQDRSRLRKAARMIGGHFAIRKFMQ